MITLPAAEFLDSTGSSIAYVNSLLASLWFDPEHVKDRTFQVRFDPKTERLVAVKP